MKNTQIKTFIKEAKIVNYKRVGYEDLITVGLIVDSNIIKNQKFYKKITKKSKVTFMRDIYAQSPIRSDLFDSEHCPNCGSPLKISIKGECEYCHMIVSSGKFQWNICDIEEEEIEVRGEKR